MNTLTDAARRAFLEGQVAWSSDDIRVVAVTARDGSASSRATLDQLDVSTRVGWSGPLTGRSASAAGYAMADDTLILAPTVAAVIQALWVVQMGVDDPSSLLVAYYDTRSDGTAVAVTSDGTDLPVQLDATGFGLFRL